MGLNDSFHGWNKEAIIDYNDFINDSLICKN